MLSFGLLMAFVVNLANAQNLIDNGGFEEYTEAPDGFGQINRATSWENVIRSADFINTGYPGWHAVSDSANTGTGYAGFASYSQRGQASEAIGQRIAKNPLKARQVYRVSFFAKRQAEGSFDSQCAGVSVYGFNRAWSPTGLQDRHVKDFLGATLLWKSDKVTSENWTLMEGCLKPRIDIRYLVFTVEYGSGCKQYILIDDIHVVPQPGDLLEGPDEDTTACPCLMYVPDAFSPNADGVNDSFKAKLNCGIENFELVIFNRWGECIFVTNDPEAYWDGWFGKLEAPIGIYLYILRYRRTDGKQIEENGRISLIR